MAIRKTKAKQVFDIQTARPSAVQEPMSVVELKLRDLGEKLGDGPAWVLVQEIAEILSESALMLRRRERLDEASELLAELERHYETDLKCVLERLER